jgi:hypothetical protein
MFEGDEEEFVVPTTKSISWPSVKTKNEFNPKSETTGLTRLREITNAHDMEELKDEIIYKKESANDMIREILPTLFPVFEPVLKQMQTVEARKLFDDEDYSGLLRTKEKKRPIISTKMLIEMRDAYMKSKPAPAAPKRKAAAVPDTPPAAKRADTSHDGVREFLNLYKLKQNGWGAEQLKVCVSLMEGMAVEEIVFLHQVIGKMLSIHESDKTNSLLWVYIKKGLMHGSIPMDHLSFVTFLMDQPNFKDMVEKCTKMPLPTEIELFIEDILKK